MRPFFGIVSLVLLSACVQTSYVPLGRPAGAARPTVEPFQVAVYRTADRVPGKYEEIGLISAVGGMAHSEATMIEAMRKKAAAIGANAIILDSMSEPSDGARIAAYALGTPQPYRRGKVVAILVRDE